MTTRLLQSDWSMYANGSTKPASTGARMTDLENGRSCVILFFETDLPLPLAELDCMEKKWDFSRRIVTLVGDFRPLLSPS